MDKWEITQSAQDVRIKELLADGWEPYGVTQEKYYGPHHPIETPPSTRTVTHFKRKVK